MKRVPLSSLSVFIFLLILSKLLSAQAPIGIFSASSDVGAGLHRGEATYDKATQTYTVTGSGTNIWVPPDEFQFVWKKVSGDFALTADAEMLTKDGDPHRKAVLMV